MDGYYAEFDVPYFENGLANVRERINRRANSIESCEVHSCRTNLTYSRYGPELRELVLRVEGVLANAELHRVSAWIQISGFWG